MKKDLFLTPEKLPLKVLAIINEFITEEQDYEVCSLLVQRLNKVGYTCEFGLEAMPYNLQKLKTK